MSYVSLIPHHPKKLVTKTIKDRDYLPFDIDIYLIDLEIGDIYTIGAPIKNLYKDRKSIFLSYKRPKIGEIGHYETIDVIRNNKIDTFFEHDDEFTLIVKKRFLEMVK